MSKQERMRQTSEQARKPGKKISEQKARCEKDSRLKVSGNQTARKQTSTNQRASKPASKNGTNQSKKINLRETIKHESKPARKQP